MVANRCYDACRKQQIMITSQGNCYPPKLNRILQLLISYSLMFIHITSNNWGLGIYLQTTTEKDTRVHKGQKEVSK